MKTNSVHRFTEVHASPVHLKGTLTAALLCVVLGCGPSYQIIAPTYLDSYNDQEYQRRNSVVHLQSRLAAPEGYEFETSEDQNVLFKFNDQMGNVVGSFAYVHTKADRSLSAEGVAKFWAESALDEYDNKELSKTYIDGKEAYIIKTRTKGSFDLFYALIPEGVNLNAIRIAADENYLHTHLDIPYSIFASYRLEKKGVSERILKGGLSFRCEDNIWTWAGDNKAGDGYLISARLGNNEVMLKVQRIQGSDIYDLVKKQEMKVNDNVKANSDFTVQKSTTMVTLGGKSVFADCIANQNRGTRAYFFLLNPGGKAYLITLASDPMAFAGDRNNALNISFFKEAFDRYLFFNE